MTSSARPYNTDAYSQHLVPRTPHSRGGRAITSFAQNQEDADEVDFLQTSPLLQSSASPHFPPDQLPTYEREDSKSKRPSRFGALMTVRNWLMNAFERAPLAIGTVVALLLFGLWVLSIKKPEVLQKVIGTNSTNSEDATAQHTGSKLAAASIPIDYSNYTEFPLTSMQYEERCWKVANAMQGHGHGDFWDVAKGMDWDVPHVNGPAICSSTITYLLDGTTGLTFHLAIIAQLAAMARERGRTLVINDHYWNRGKWTDHFQDVRKTQPGPEPDCLPPPPQELVACPRTAKHWVITPRTAKFHLGHQFDDHYQDPYQSGISRYKPFYDRAKESFDKTILPIATVQEHLDYLRSTWGNKPYIGVHIRRGDRFADNQKWKGDYVPISEYSAGVIKTWQKLKETTPPQVTGESPNVYLATDSNAAFNDYKALSAAPDSVFGLYDASKTVIKYMAQPHGYIQTLWERKSRIEERQRWTDGMILDLAMISGLWLKEGDRPPLATLCTLTSNVCRLAALGLGWDRALVEGFWVDLDWNGMVYPQWEAFELA